MNPTNQLPCGGVVKMGKQKKYYILLSENEVELLTSGLEMAVKALEFSSNDIIACHVSNSPVTIRLLETRVKMQAFTGHLWRRFTEAKKGS